MGTPIARQHLMVYHIVYDLVQLSYEDNVDPEHMQQLQNI